MTHTCSECGNEYNSQRGLSLHRTKAHNPKYKDKNWLEEKYQKERLSCSEIGDMTNTSRECIRRSLEENGIPVRTDGIENKERRWKDEDTLRELYIERELPLAEVAGKLGCDSITVGRWLKRHGIETRPANPKKGAGEIQLSVNRSGYKIIRHGYSGPTVVLHRLIAVAEYGFDQVVGNVVHHENGVTWDNRVENLEIMTRGEHTKEHHERGDCPGFSDDNRSTVFPEENRYYNIRERKQ